MDVRTERRIVTSLFVDVVGSTDEMMRLGPEQMQRRLADAFDHMSRTISDHGGTVEKYVGDAIFALFGAPAAHVDDPERALRAADACARWSSTGSLSTDRLAIRVGIETGEALVDLTALEQRQRMAIGSCVTIAARLQQHADPGAIVVGPTCHAATEGLAQFESLATLDLKGLGPIEAWRFLGFAPGAAAPEVPFIGREAELKLLADAARQAESGTATLALIVGTPGLGKTRLAEEAIRAWRDTRRARLMQARCRPGAEVGANTPLRQLIDQDVADATPAALRSRLEALLDPGDGADIDAAISHSAGLAADERLLAVSRYEQREIIADAWRRYLAALSREQPLIVSVEDLHWADPVLVRIIDHVTSELEAPLLVIATARPEFVGSAHLRPSEHRFQVDLEPLDEDSANLLAVSAGDGVAASDRAAGNPLFILELARSRATDKDIPLTIQAAIAARLDELAPDERTLLQRASACGETFGVRDAALLDDREPAEAAGMLGRIAHLGFVTPVGSSYRFHHALAHDVAYGRLPVAERMMLHARYAEQGIDPADVEARAHHLWEAVDPENAHWVWHDEVRLDALRRAAFEAHIAAGARLEERNQYEQALPVYERAVQLAPDPAKLGLAEDMLGRAFARQGRGDESWERRLRALDAYRQAGMAPPSRLYGDMLEIATMNWGYFHELPAEEDVMGLLDEGERTARASTDDAALAQLLVERATFTGDLSAADEIVHFVEAPDAVRFADAAQRLAQVYVWSGQIARGVDLFRTVFERLIPSGAVINEPEAMMWYGLGAFVTGDHDLTDGLVDRARRDAERRSPHTRQHFLGLRTFVALCRGEWDQVEAVTRELDELIEGNPDASFCLMGANAFGYGATAGVLHARPLRRDLDERAARMVPQSTLIQGGAVMLAKAMVGDTAAVDRGLASYAPGLRLRDRQTVWDVCHLMPAIALTIIERWDQLEGTLARLDECAAGGGRLAGAAAAAIREERAHGSGGPPPTHEELRALRLFGIDQLLRFRPSGGKGS